MTTTLRRRLALGSALAMVLVVIAVLLAVSVFTRVAIGGVLVGLAITSTGLLGGVFVFARAGVGLAAAGYLLTVLGSDDPRWEAGLVGVALWCCLDLADRSINQRHGSFVGPFLEVCGAAAALTVVAIVARMLAAGGSLVATSIALTMVVGILASMVVAVRRERA